MTLCWVTKPPCPEEGTEEVDIPLGGSVTVLVCPKHAEELRGETWDL